MNITYLQADLRYNKQLTKNIMGETVIEYTLKRIEKLDCQKIIAGIYGCKENEPLIKILESRGVQVVISDDDDVNSRFINLVTKEEADYVIRVGGDQLLLDTKRTNMILKEMQEQHKDFFYDDNISSVIPDIVSVNCLIRYKDDILKADRYFHVLTKETSINRYTIIWPCIILFSFRADSDSGYRLCKEVIERNLDIYELSRSLSVMLKMKGNYLNRTGIWQSWVLGSAIGNELLVFYDEEGKVNPWWGRTVIDLVQGKLKKEFRVFEWGSGNSTLFWSQYVREVVAVEHSVEWYNMMKNIVPNNVRLQFCELEYGGDYSKSILNEKEKFDIILIDGRDRVNCALNSLEHLTENGIIIWDNTDRDYYQEGKEFIKSHGFKQLELSSIMYQAAYIEGYTSIFYREGNFLGL